MALPFIVVLDSGDRSLRGADRWADAPLVLALCEEGGWWQQGLLDHIAQCTYHRPHGCAFDERQFRP